VERFRSACAETDRKVEEILSKIESGEPYNNHFWPTSRLLINGIKLYRFEADLDRVALELGLQLPLPVIATNGTKPNLTSKQIARVQAIYADDIALYNSITEAGQVWEAPEPKPEPITVPTSLTRRQFHLAALSLGITKEVILDAIEGIEDETQRAYAKVDYGESSEFKRDWSLLIEMAHILNLTDDQIDQAFIEGNSL
jgi:hypothetical protein